jgi:hypothetical protein
VHLPAGFIARFGQGFEKTVPVVVVPENAFPTVTAIHQMVDSAGILHSEFARHGGTLPKTGRMSIVMTDPFYVLAHHRLCRGRWRAKSAKRKGQTLRRHLQVLCTVCLRHPRTEAFRKRLSGPEQKLLFTCFRRPQVPPTNNQAERSLRPLVIMRKIVQGTRSDKGLENHSVLRSLFETARRQGKKPHEFFLALLTKTAAQAQAALYRKPLNRRPAPPLRC